MRRAHHRSAEDRQLAHHGHALQLEVVGKDHVAADVGEHRERGGGDDGAADRQPVQPIGQVHGVRCAHQTSITKITKGSKREQRQDAESCSATHATASRAAGS